MTGPKRLNNRNFMEQMHKVYYGNETEEEAKQATNPMRMSKTGHGGVPIDFDLYGMVKV
jgi:hypothetical protein